MPCRRFLAALTAAMLLVVYSGCGSEEKNNTSSTGSSGPTQAKAGDKMGGQAASADNQLASSGSRAASADSRVASANSQAASTEKGVIDLSLVTPEDFAAIVIHPRRIAQSPLVAEILKNKIPAEAIKRSGFDPSEVEEVVVLSSMIKRYPGPEEQFPAVTQPMPTFIVRFTRAVDVKAVLTKLQVLEDNPGPNVINEVKVGGKTCLDGGGIMMAYAPAKDTIVLAPREIMAKVVSGAEPKGPLFERLKRADAANDIVVVLEPGAYPDFDKAIDAEKKAAPNLDLTWLKTVRGGTATFTLTASPMLHAVLDTNDAEAASQAEESLQQALRMAGASLLVAKQGIPKEAQAAFLPLLKLADQLSAGAKAAKSGSQVVLDVKRPEILDTAGPSAIGGAIVGAVEQYVRESRRAQQMSKLRAISLAMLNYQSVQKSFPPAAIERDGKPLLSWRVAILPYLGATDLYRLFRFDEPWDSPHNLEVAKIMPLVFQSPDSPGDGQTQVMVFTGKGAAFGGGRRPQLTDIRNGLSNTILCVEAGPDKAVPWTKPEDLPFDPEKPLAALGNVPHGFLAAFFDGHVEQMNVDNRTLKALITPDGNEVIDPAKVHGGP